MLSKKVFLAGEPNFSAPPVHAARSDVRDHVESQEGDYRASYALGRGLQKRRQANTVFREISGAAQFSTFSTASVKNGRRAWCPEATGVPQKADRLAAGRDFGLGPKAEIMQRSKSPPRRA